VSSRTLGQGSLLDPVLQKLHSPLTLVINLEVPDEVILGRIADRWIHAKSGRVYNLSYNRPMISGVDDLTGEPLTKRADDNPEVAARRLEVFYKTTSPLLQYYTARSTSPGAPSPTPSPLGPHAIQSPPHLVTLAGSTSDEIWPQLEDVVQRYFGLRAVRSSVVEPSLAVEGSRLAKGVS